MKTETQKAVLCTAWGLPETLVVQHIPRKQAGPNEVAIDVKAAGVNFPDTLIIQKKYQFQPDLPFSPGGEVAGVVEAVGDGVTHVKPGDRVIASFAWGGFATQAIAPAERVVRIPDQMDFTTASAYVLAYGTALYALTLRGKVQPGETVLVLGAAGGTGIAAIEIAKSLGARVIAMASTDEKLALCKQHGADICVNYATENFRDRIKEITQGKGVDVVFDPVGGEYTELAFRSIGWEGRHLVVGFAAGDIPRVPLNLALLKGASLVGVFWADYLRRDRAEAERHMQALMDLYTSGKVNPPVTQTYPFEDVAKALRSIMNRQAMGKVVLVP